MHRMGVYLGLVEEDEDYADVDGYGHSAERAPGRRERDEYSEPRYLRENGHRENGHREISHREISHRDSDAPSYHRPVDDDPRGFPEEYRPSYQITALHPRTYNEARTIGEHFRKSTPVIMNLSDMDDADAKRLVDFAAGLTFGLHGRIERVTAKVFLLSPHNVTVTASDKAKIESGFFNQS
jgi:cell division inhibitor SepF